MPRFFRLIALTTVILATACAPDAGPRESTGTLIGAGVGALIGSQIGHGDTRLLAVAIGTLAGSQIGGYIGRQLDEKDRQHMQKTTQNALENKPAGETATWRNPESGHEGTVTPQDSFTTSQGRECREFQQTVTVEADTATAYGTACKQPDGSWKVVSG